MIIGFRALRPDDRLSVQIRPDVLGLFLRSDYSPSSAESSLMSSRMYALVFGRSRFFAFRF